MFGAFNTFGRLGAGARAVAAAWSPASLFAAGEAGGLWDFSTLANLYQDSAGTTPCTAVGDPIGLVLDTKNGTPQLGPELAGSPFIAYTGNGTASESGGVTTATCTTNGTYGLRLHTNLSTGGATYLITFDVVTNSASRSLVLYENLNSPGYAIGITGVKTCRITAVASSGSDANMAFIMFGGLVGESFSIRSVSQKVISGNHLTQSTSTKRPVLGRMPATGVRNLLVNTATLSTQSVYVAAGSHTIQFTGAGSVTASGTYSGALTNGQTFTCTAGTLTLTVSGSVTNAQLEAGSTATAKQVVGAAYDITESGVASVYTAYFDGVDDCLVSPSIDFSGTDAMSVFSGFRKTSDAARGMVAELSATTDSNNGSFALTAPNAASATIVYESKGTALTDTSATIAAPADSVIAAVSDISADSNVLRRNGAEAESDTGDQGTGNFGNYPLYIGERGASSLPYKGFMTALSTRGATTDADTIVKMEKWLAARTPGVTLP